MNELFLRLLNMSMTGGVLIAVILLLRIVLSRAPKWVCCVLWALAALRLACPLAIASPACVFSLLRLQPDDGGKAAYFHAGGGTEKPLVEFAVPQLSVPAPETGLLPGLSPAVTVRTGSVFLPTLTRLWLVGLAVLLLYVLIAGLLLRWRVRASVRLEANVYLCDAVDSPFILGLLRPRIYLPSDLDQALWPAVLAHERAHIRRGDPVWKLLGFLLLSVHWFNPLVWLGYVMFCRDMELACDARVIRDMEQPARIAYTRALLACSTQRRLPGVCPPAFCESGARQRIAFVLRYKKTAAVGVVAALVLCAVVAVCFLTEPVKRLPTEVVVAAADLDRDGSDEQIVVTTRRDEADGVVYGAEVSVRRDDGTQLWRTELNTSHAGWGSVFLCRLDSGADGYWQGLDWLMVCRSNYSTGTGVCYYELSDARQGTLRSELLEYVAAPPGAMALDGERMEAYAGELNALLAGSTLLASTEGGQLVIGPSSAEAYYEDFSEFLDGVPFSYPEGLPLAGKIEYYEARQRDALPRQASEPTR